MLSYLQQEDPQDKQLENKKRSDSFPNIQGFFTQGCGAMHHRKQLWYIGCSEQLMTLL